MRDGVKVTTRLNDDKGVSLFNDNGHVCGSTIVPSSSQMHTGCLSFNSGSSLLAGPFADSSC